jgi:hypothetical protein
VVALVNLFNIYRMPAGRRTFGLRKVRLLVGTEPDLLHLVDDAMAQDGKVLALRGRWLVSRSKNPKYPPRLIALDLEHDRLVASMVRVADAMVSGTDEESPLGVAARRLVDGVFAAGVAALTQLDFVQQRESTGSWLARLTGDLSDDAVLIGLQPMRDRLVAVNQEFGSLLDAFEPASKVSFEGLRKEDLLGQELMLRVVAAIAGRYTGSKDGDDAKRAALLAPILQQNDQVGESYRRKRTITDVDPDSGEVVTDPVEA